MGYCDQVINMRATQCNHRKDVDKCPITLNTKLGCELKTTITNKGAKILVSPKVQISVAPHDPLVSWIAVSASRTKRTPPGCTDLDHEIKALQLSRLIKFINFISV